jgi:hypothetical protein
MNKLEGWTKILDRGMKVSDEETKILNGGMKTVEGRG